MLACLLSLLPKAFLEPLHEVQQVLCDILLLPNLLSIVIIVDHIAQNRRWVHVFLIREHQVGHELLQMRGHDRALLLACQKLQLILLHLPLVRILRLNILCESYLLCVLIRNTSIQELEGDVGQEEESLDEGVEVAGVAHVFESYRDVVDSTSLVKREGLTLQAGLDGRFYVRVSERRLLW